MEASNLEASEESPKIVEVTKITFFIFILVNDYTRFRRGYFSPKKHLGTWYPPVSDTTGSLELDDSWRVPSILEYLGGYHYLGWVPEIVRGTRAVGLDSKRRPVWQLGWSCTGLSNTWIWLSQKARWQMSPSTRKTSQMGTPGDKLRIGTKPVNEQLRITSGLQKILTLPKRTSRNPGQIHPQGMKWFLALKSLDDIARRSGKPHPGKQQQTLRSQHSSGPLLPYGGLSGIFSFSAIGCVVRTLNAWTEKG